ncbi:MAG: orotidine-5'-phosphate decarboxylase [Phycisphaeraceae bacterium]
MQHFADRLNNAVDRIGSPVCVGLDPVLERLPAAVGWDSPTQRIEAFCHGVIEAVSGQVAMVKPQLACFERYGSAGWAVYERVVAHARAAGLLVLADAKRGDIGISAAHYAAALLEGEHAADAMTVNPYLGPDTLEPFVDTAARVGGGVFALVRTSNPGSDALQALQLADGRTVAQAVADTVRELGRPHVGRCGESLLGAVVGATKADDAAALRKRMPEQVFLLPGYGAQGATADDVRASFHENREGEPLPRGAIVTASRSVIYAFDEHAKDWPDAVGAAAQRFASEVREALLR